MEIAFYVIEVNLFCDIVWKEKKNQERSTINRFPDLPVRRAAIDFPIMIFYCFQLIFIINFALLNRKDFFNSIRKQFL